MHIINDRNANNPTCYLNVGSRYTVLQSAHSRLRQLDRLHCYSIALW